MNHKEFYDKLMKLVSLGDDCFYYKDEQLDGITYRIFNYRIAQYSQWILDGALECRGHMFRLSPSGECEALVCLPLPKFFNLNENPFTQNINYDIDRVTEKADGSLISTFLHNGEMRFKTKGTLFSQQARDAYNWCLKHAPDFFYSLETCTRNGNTINLEWCSPSNRIVLKYPESKLSLINIRNISTFEIAPQALINFFWSDRCLKDLDSIHWLSNPVEFVNNIPAMEGIEGFVLTMKNGQMIKVKTNWYLHLHRCKESIDEPKRLFEAIINETQDDLRSLFADDEFSLSKIKEMEEKVIPKYNKMQALVEGFYLENKALSRKDYAIKGQKELGPYFGLGMLLYTGKEPGYKEFAMKHKEHFLEA